MMIDLMMVDICSMVTRKLADGVVERADVIWHPGSLVAPHRPLVVVPPVTALGAHS